VKLVHVKGVRIEGQNQKAP